jgi:uncharacterized membrane protein
MAAPGSDWGFAMGFDLRLAAALGGAALLGSIAAGCEASDPWEEAHCPPNGTPLTYDAFANPFFTRYCNECHGRHVRERHGAPDGYFFDTHDDILQWKEHIYERSAGENDSMPPGPDDPPVEARAELAEWLACGAP